ncbi:hypothetical protein CDAR_539071 [Caerostris darwini]|uniref:Uncharacterized protein n=1 Tax=Caerostris darwini TaxID=1538125 RepID=A0AAV4T2E1_9ARAC|nr:hypothetical protein CDAR_539071 [Caerostris darwini]
MLLNEIEISGRQCYQAKPPIAEDNVAKRNHRMRMTMLPDETTYCGWQCWQTKIRNRRFRVRCSSYVEIFCFTFLQPLLRQKCPLLDCNSPPETPITPVIVPSLPHKNFYGGFDSKGAPVSSPRDSTPAAVKIVWCQKRRGTGRNTANDPTGNIACFVLATECLSEDKETPRGIAGKEQTISARGCF